MKQHRQIINRMAEPIKLLADKLEEHKYQRKKTVRLIEHPKYTEGEQPYLSLNNRFMLCLK